jgi:hypothetical protein
VSAINPLVLGTGDLANLERQLSRAQDLFIGVVCGRSEEGKAEDFQEALGIIREVRLSLESAIPTEGAAS